MKKILVLKLLFLGINLPIFSQYYEVEPNNGWAEATVITDWGPGIFCGSTSDWSGDLWKLELAPGDYTFSWANDGLTHVAIKQYGPNYDPAVDSFWPNGTFSVAQSSCDGSDLYTGCTLIDNLLPDYSTNDLPCGEDLVDITNETFTVLPGDYVYYIQINAHCGGTDYCPEPECSIFFSGLNVPSAPTDGNYTITGELTFSEQPTTGTLTICDNISGICDTHTAPFTSPLNFSLANIPGDAQNHLITAVFSDLTECAAAEEVFLEEPTLDVDFISSENQCLIGNTFEFDCIGDGNNSTADSYTWDFGDGLGTSTLEDPTYSYAAAGIYTVVLTVDAYGTTGTISYDVEVYAHPELAISSTSPLCHGDNNGSLNPNVSGGTAPYTYQWLLEGGNTSNSGTQTGLIAGTYNLTVTDANGCTVHDEHIITEPSELIITDSGATDNLCFGDSNGEVWLTVEGGSPNYTYNWGNAYPNSNTISGLANGTYTVTVVDQNACEILFSENIDGPSSPLQIDNIIATDVACNGENNGTLTAQVSGGTVPYSYNWGLENGGTTYGHSLSNLSSGTYYLTVIDGNNCEVMGSQNVVEPPGIELEYYSIPTSCYGYNDGKIWVEPSSGTPPYTYQWSSGWTDSVIINSEATAYSITVTDSRGCLGIYEDIEVQQPNQVIASAQTPATICPGETTNLLVSVTSSPFTPYSYYWDNVHGSESITVNPNETTTYTAKVFDANGCESTPIEITVEVYDSLSVELSIDKTNICKGEQVHVNVEVTGGNGNNLYTLNGQEYTNPNIIISPEASQEYELIVSNDCSMPEVIKLFNITVEDAFTPSFHVDTRYGCEPLEVKFNQDTQGHTEGTEYVWELGNTMSLEENPSILFENSGVFHVTLNIITPKGCEYSETKHNYITVYPKPEAIFNIENQQVSKFNPNIYFDNQSEGADYCIWSFGDGDSSLIWSPLHSYPKYQQTYQVDLTAVNRFECTDTKTLEVEIEDETSLFIPTAFSPDNDGRNEVFKAFGNGILTEDYQLTVYDRWGEAIFTSTDFNLGWDGTVKGGDIAKPGMYVYLIQYLDANSVQRERSGNVILIR